MSGMHMSKENATHDVSHITHEERVVGLVQMIYAPVGVLWVETMISRAAGQSHIIQSPRMNRQERRNMMEKHTCRSITNLVVGSYAGKLLWNTVKVFDDRIKTLACMSLVVRLIGSVVDVDVQCDK